MRLIQFVLVAAVLAGFLFYLKYLRSVLRDRLIATILVIVGITAICLPDGTTVVANFFGVGRGADLLLYFLIVGSAFLFMLLYSKLAEVERVQTELVRHLAIASARRPEQPAPGRD